MTRSAARIVCAAAAVVAGLPAVPSRAQTSARLFCRWGKLAKMAPVPKCGVPRELEVKVPADTWKLYFLRAENPGLSGYFHQGRGPGQQPKVFQRKVNLVNVVLLLCPADFKSERVLAFQRFNNQRRLVGRPTCRLGPASGAAGQPRPGTGPADTAQPRPRPTADAGSGTLTGTPKAEPGTAVPSAAAGKGAGSGQGVYAAAAGSRPASAGSSAWKKIDRLARLLGLTALAVALCCLVALAVLYRHFSRKLRRFGDE